jgi:pimeloyl-ACP methyl ester carboxylesterase
VTTFVLVHGAWHGGWSWQPVARRLRAAGHEVVTPTLTGLGERAHLLDRGVGLDTHVRDVTAVLTYEDLDDVIMVGHSYAGMVVTGAAAQVPERIRRLVILDGFLPEAGEMAINLLPEHAAAHYRDSAAEQGDGWWIPPRPLANLGVTDEDAIAWLSPRLTPHPLKTYLDQAADGASQLTVPGTYLLCTGWASPFTPSAERAASHGWSVSEVHGDHEVMVTDVALLFDHLLQPGAAVTAPFEGTRA